MKFKPYTISEKYNSFIWLPPKCASHTISWVLAYFDFTSILIDTETNSIHRKLNPSTHFGHSTILPSNHEELSFICATRNPYHRVLSMYSSMYSNLTMDSSVEDFEKFVNERVITDSSWFNYSSILKERRPDYLLRTENLCEDLIKIPFIRDSDLSTSGILKNFCVKKSNRSYNQLNPDEYLTPSIKQTIYNVSSDHFDLFGYER
jgi:hypothetical protein